MTHDEMIAVIQAHKDGKQIQWKSRTSYIWAQDCMPPNGRFDFTNFDYRIKPEERKPREVRVKIKDNGADWILPMLSDDADGIVIFREVLE